MNESTETIIRGFRAAKLTTSERETLLIRRAWTRAERKIVLNGFFGRLTIAIEPAICAAGFLGLTLGLVFNKNKEIIILAPIFALGVVAFTIYMIAVMVAPVRALLQTVRPIYIVDGYVRYRGRDEHSDEDSNGYLAVLTDDRRVACEWPTIGEVELPPDVRPALCEFSEFGGVHTIDGRATGVLPKTMPRFGVGGRSRAREFTE